MAGNFRELRTRFFDLLVLTVLSAMVIFPAPWTEQAVGQLCAWISDCPRYLGRSCLSPRWWPLPPRGVIFQPDLDVTKGGRGKSVFWYVWYGIILTFPYSLFLPLAIRDLRQRGYSVPLAEVIETCIIGNTSSCFCIQCEWCAEYCNVLLQKHQR